MTEEADTQPEDFNIHLHATMRDLDSDQMDIRPFFVLGKDPMVLIEFAKGGEDDDLHISLDTTGFEKDQLISMLRTVIEAMENGVEVTPGKGETPG